MLTYSRGAFVASISFLGVASVARAAIVVVPANLAIPGTPSGLYINIQTGTSSTTASGAPGWDINVGGIASLNFLSSGGYNFVRLNGAPVTTGPSDLTTGFMIANSMATASWITGGVAADLTLNSSINYIGFRFVGNDSATHLGWMQLAIRSSTTGAERTIVSYGYNTVSSSLPGGTTIAAGIVPSPGALVLLCQAGFMARRRRR